MNRLYMVEFSSACPPAQVVECTGSRPTRALEAHTQNLSIFQTLVCLVCLEAGAEGQSFADFQGNMVICMDSALMLDPVLDPELDPKLDVHSDLELDLC